MLEADPTNTMVMFGLAKEYEKEARFADVIRVLTTYIEQADDEGNAYGSLANSYARTGETAKAAETYRRGAAVSLRHGHPSMANEFEMLADELGS